MSGCFCAQCVRTQQVAVLEDLGQFKGLLEPGLHCTCWPLSQIAGTLSLRIQQLDVVCETKTRDNVFVQVAVAVQFRVLLESAYDAYYRLTDPKGQIQSYVFDVVRSTVPKMELDEAFASKAEIASATLDQLKDVMKVSILLNNESRVASTIAIVYLARLTHLAYYSSCFHHLHFPLLFQQDYGYEILTTLVTDMSPDAKVKASMNEINASRRLKEAASHKAEADKVRQVKAAEAEAEARYLSGLGVARQRKAIVEGLQSSVSEFSSQVEGATPKDVMDIL